MGPGKKSLVYESQMNIFLTVGQLKLELTFCKWIAVISYLWNRNDTTVKIRHFILPFSFTEGLGISVRYKTINV